MRQAPIARIGYQPPVGKAGEVEATTVAAMLDRAGAAEFSGVQRPEFHLLLAVTGGRGRHMVDFREYDLEPGSVLWLRPGQVQRWGDLDGYDASVLIFPAGLLDPETARLTSAEAPYAAHHWRLSPEARRQLGQVFAAVVERADDTTLPRELRAPMLTHLLAALLLQLTAHSSVDVPPGAESPAYAGFRELVEREHAEHHDVAWYAERLGYSTRTLARATRAATGASPKQLVDERIVLEARRLLAHSDLTVARIGAGLGFDDPSNFTAWFQQRAGQTPSAFRRTTR